MGWLSPVRVEDVDSAEMFARYAEYVLGVPYPTRKDLTILRKKAKELFAMYPTMSWASLCRVVDWAKARKRRFARTFALVDCFRDAWAAGYLPELDPESREANPDLEQAISDALVVERSAFWRERLIGAQGVAARTQVYQAWAESQQRVAS